MRNESRVSRPACVELTVAHKLSSHVAVASIAVVDAEVPKPSGIVVPLWPGDAYTAEAIGILSNAECVNDGVGFLSLQPATSEYVALHGLPLVQVVGQRFVYRERMRLLISDFGGLKVLSLVYWRIIRSSMASGL